MVAGVNAFMSNPDKQRVVEKYTSLIKKCINEIEELKAKIEDCKILLQRLKDITKLS